MHPRHACHLCLQTYLKICGAEAEIRLADNPLRSPSGQFPVLRHEQTVLSSLDDITLYLKRKVRQHRP